MEPAQAGAADAGPTRVRGKKTVAELLVEDRE